ncbi:MAG: hypothetical protein NZ810_06110 [Dehalococcoidia bacterium]|nr:hypothetical protein [Dehalococcoidia bacterium]
MPAVRRVITRALAADQWLAGLTYHEQHRALLKGLLLFNTVGG